MKKMATKVWGALFLGLLWGHFAWAIEADIPAGDSTVIIEPTSELAAFSIFTIEKTRIKVDPSASADKEGYRMEGSFSLGTNSNGIFPISEAVRLVVGPSEIIIQPNMFTSGRNSFEFKGMIQAGPFSFINLAMSIRMEGYNMFAFKVDAKGISLSRSSMPMTLNPTISLHIGDDIGTTTINLGGKLDYKNEGGNTGGFPGYPFPGAPGQPFPNNGGEEEDD